VSAVAFAKLRAGSMRYMGFARSQAALPGVKVYHGWDSLMQDWKAELERLAHGFAGGDARVTPKRGLQTCQYCALQTLCRVYERCNALAEEAAEAGE
jgi:hypothetical protein